MPPLARTAHLRGAKMLTREDVRELANLDSQLLIVVRDKVYDCTRWQDSHPGGRLTIRALCGHDATDAFDGMHPPYVQKRLKAFYYADLDPADVGAAKTSKTVQDFRTLTEEMHREGMFQTNYSFYYRKAAILVPLAALMVAAVICSQSLAVHVMAGALLGTLWQQIAFIGHDLGHNSVTHDLEMDGWLGVLLGNFLTGISIGWWKRSHNVHHIVTNSVEDDPDIQHMPIMAVDPIYVSQPVYSTFYDKYFVPSKLSHFLVSKQHIMYYPVMAFARFNLYAQSLMHAFGIVAYSPSEYMWRRKTQILALLGFWTWLLLLTFQLPTWTSRLLFFLVAHNVAGILHVQITLSHFCMPSYTGNNYDIAKLDKDEGGYINVQLDGSLDIDCSKYMDWFHGGLQFQAVHHLWPRMPRHNLRAAQARLISFCASHDLKYHRASFFKANGIMLARLRRTARAAQSLSSLFSDSINMAG
ncbi:unnamed protein product [Chrysoparadoxa australica]